MLPFYYSPRMMVKRLLKTVVFCVNNFVWKKVVSHTLPPLAIVEGTMLYFRLHFRVLHAEFLQTRKGTYNTMAQSTTYEVALWPNGNMQCGMSFFSLETG